MPNTAHAAVGALLGRIRAETRGSMAVLLGPDQEPVAVDAARRAAEMPWWCAAMNEVTARWATRHELDRADSAILVDGAFVLTAWLAPHGALLVDLPPGDSFGIALVRTRPLFEELQLALDRDTSSGGGGTGDGGAPGTVTVHAERREADANTDAERWFVSLSEEKDQEP